MVIVYFVVSFIVVYCFNRNIINFELLMLRFAASSLFISLTAHLL